MFETWASYGLPNEDLYAYLIERNIDSFEYMNTIWSHVIYYSPFLRTAREFVIPPNVKEFGPCVFSRCVDLKSIKFTQCINSFPERMLDRVNIVWPDTMATFKRIPKGFNWNARTNVTVHCLDGDITYEYKPFTRA